MMVRRRTHPGIECDGCKQDPLTGARYTLQNVPTSWGERWCTCNDTVDYCEACYNRLDPARKLQFDYIEPPLPACCCLGEADDAPDHGNVNADLDDAFGMPGDQGRIPDLERFVTPPDLPIRDIEMGLPATPAVTTETAAVSSTVPPPPLPPPRGYSGIYRAHEGECSQEGECVVCLSEPRGTCRFMPCGHAVTCDYCAQVQLRAGSGCVICRAPVQVVERGVFPESYTLTPQQTTGDRVEAPVAPIVKKPSGASVRFQAGYDENQQRHLIGHAPGWLSGDETVRWYSAATPEERAEIEMTSANHPSGTHRSC